MVFFPSNVLLNIMKGTPQNSCSGCLVKDPTALKLSNTKEKRNKNALNYKGFTQNFKSGLFKFKISV